MTTADYRDLLPEDTAVDLTQQAERAKRAVDNFRRMIPMLNNYARAFTRNQRISVEISATNNGATDGKKIYFRPPIALGDDHKHVRRLCDNRDPDTLLQECPACAVREEILVTIYHEIAHICYGTFDQPSDITKNELVAAAATEAGGRWGEYVATQIRKESRNPISSYLSMANLISPFLPIILNAIEDARVNANLFSARKGTKLMFEADTRKLFENGVEYVETSTGEIKYKMWNEREQNIQAIIALFCAASSYEYEDWFIPEVVAAIQDTELSELIESVRSAITVEENYGISFKLLSRLRELGYCTRKNEPDQPEQQLEEEKSEKSEQSEQEDQPTESQPEGEPSDQAASSEESASPEKNSEGDQSSSVSPKTSYSKEGEEEDENNSSETEADPTGDSAESTSEGEGASSAVAGDSDGPASDDSGADESGLDNDSDSSKSEDTDSEEYSDEESSELKKSGDGSDPSGNVGNCTPAPSTEEEKDSFEAGEQQESLTGTGDIELPSGESDSHGDEEPSGLVEVEETETDETIQTPDRDAVDLTNTELSEQSAGEPEDIQAALDFFGHHDPEQVIPVTPIEEAALNQAILQGYYFESPSTEITGVREHKYGIPVIDETSHNLSTAWGGKLYAQSYSSCEMGLSGDFVPVEGTLGRALLKLRTVLADNQRSRHQAHLKSGRINTRVLGRRAPLGDERLFRKKIVPGKRDYFVAIGLDISGSTVGTNLQLIKAAGWAQAELLKRMGIPFSIHAMTANYGFVAGSDYNLSLDMYEIKLPDEPWNKVTQERMQAIGPDGGNLDGHNLEYLRRLCDKQRATDKIIMYYSDGQMPATNYEEELEILQRELKTCKQRSYTVAGVGVRTDSPSQYGLPTVQIDNKEDIHKVVSHLERVLLRR